MQFAYFHIILKARESFKVVVSVDLTFSNEHPNRYYSGPA